MKECIKELNNLIASICYILLGFLWIAGIVLANGWFKLLAIFPFYSFYLVVEKIMKMYGLV